MVQEIERWLCQRGLHRWENWGTTEEVPLRPEEGDTSILGGLSNGIYVEIKTRTCKCCGKGQVRTLLHW